MTTFSLFEVYGIEIEYMIVDRETLAVLPIADRLLQAVTGKITDEADLGEISWSNELALHLIEFKTNGPTQNLAKAALAFQKSIELANEKLAAFNAMLLPTGAHPWMDPHQEVKLWPHGQNEIYQAYDQLFDCRGHGWGNLQSTHLNLPFASEEEFVKLHTAIRLLLPIIPALTASTPILDGQLTGFKDTRLFYYQNNQKNFPKITGLVIPEPIQSYAEYHEIILHPMYRSIADFDTKQLLQEEWLNSRGAIARFERNAIEIRLLDTQEFPGADIAIADLIVAVLKKFVAQDLVSLEQQLALTTEELAEIFQNVIKNGLDSNITNARYYQLFGLNAEPVSVKDIWKHLLTHSSLQDEEHRKILQYIINHGNLSERIQAQYQIKQDPEQLLKIYQNMSRCLMNGRLF